MRRRQITFMAAAVLCVALAGSATAGITGLFNTGVDGSGGALSNGSADPHYSLTYVPSGPTTALAIAPHSAWATPPADAKWIAPTPSGTPDPAGDYIFALTFNTTSAAGLIISGQWATDNSGEIFLNGADTGIGRAYGSGPSNYGFSTLEAFEITSGFFPGNNLLEFRVNNADDGGPMGLLVTDLVGTNTVPVPGAILLGGLGAGLVSLLRRRRAV